MGIDLDPLDDIFAGEAVKNARAVGKFQPKSKFRPARKDSAATSVSSSQGFQTIATSQSELSEPVRTAKPLENCLDVVSNDNGGWHASIEKSVSENADIFIGLEALGDFIPHATTDMEGSLPPSDAVALHVPNPENGGGGVPPAISPVDDSTHTCKAADGPTCPELSADLDPLTAGEPIVSSSNGCGHMHDRELGREEMDIMDSINMSELTTKSGQRTGKFQPKPKIQMHKEICEAKESVSYSLGSQSVPPEFGHAEKDLSPTFQQDDVLDLSSLGFTHTLPSEGTSELPLNEDSINLMEMTQLDSGIHLEDVPEIPAKLESRRAKTGRTKTCTASDPSPQQQKASTSSQENETGRSLRSRKSKTSFCELVDEAEDEVLASGQFSEECPISSAIEEEAANSMEFQVESESQMKKVKRKSKKPDDDQEKPARKRKKATEASDKDADEKPKKFSHATRRRRVNKVLLETPEDEIDYQKVPLRDLILLAEHKERLTKKEEAAAGATATEQSNGNSSGHHNEDGTFTSKQDGEYNNDGQGSPVVEESTIYFNYHTHMDRTPSTRWSKQETELFYEAVRQFGTDLSMIQQLFPDRTRRQVKLKYKKEERQHPLRLREALTNRPKDHSHFEKVIERLKQIAAEENQNADKDDAIGFTGNEVDEGTLDADDEAKEEQIGVEENEDVADDLIEVQSPLKSDEIEDDLFIWSQYKSDN